MMERTLGRAVHVGDVLDDARAQAIEIEVRVLRDQRVECPADAANAATRQLGALTVLEHAPDTKIPSRFSHAENVGPVDDFLVFHASQPEHEADADA